MIKIIVDKITNSMSGTVSDEIIYVVMAGKKLIKSSNPPGKFCVTFAKICESMTIHSVLLNFEKSANVNIMCITGHK